jgi:Pyruvate/2-oxoacid:ferredoxin oxidoreductase delta subunit
MSASITARSPLLVVLYEGAGAMPLDAEARFEITRVLLEKGYRIITTRAGRSGTTSGERQVLVLGRFTGEPPAEAVAGTGAAVHFRSLDGVAPADVVALVEGVGGDAQTQKPGGWKPWFPVIDYDRCTNCMQCLSFCLFDVYAVSGDQKIQVQNQSNYRGPITFRLQTAGVSLLAARLVVQNRNGQILAGVTGAGVRGDSLSVTIPRSAAGEKYYVRVLGTPDALNGVGRFAIGIARHQFCRAVALPTGPLRQEAQ